MESAELKHRTLHATIWMGLQAAISNILTFCVFIVLAHSLSRRDFGTFALSFALIEVARTVANAGLSDAVTRDEARDTRLADTAFWANLVLGCVVGALTWMLAPFYATLLAEPAITPVVHCLALLLPLSALSGIHTACCLRDFGHKSFATRIIVGNALAGGIAMGVAMAGYGVWALVIQAAIVEGVGVGFAWSSYPWRPRLRLDWRRLRHACSFSLTMMLTRLLGVLLVRIQDVVIGRCISVTAVGTWRIAWRMIDLIAQTTIQPVVGVSFVTLSQLQHDAERFRRAFLRMLGLGALLAFPAIAGFGVLSGDLIPLLFGAKWTASGEVARILALLAIPFAMNFFIGPALAALGCSATIAKGAAVQTAAALGFALLAAPFGLPWVAAAYVLRAFLTMPYQLVLFRRETGIGPRAMLQAVLPPLLAALAMTVCLMLLHPSLSRMPVHRVTYVLVTALLGCCIFAVSLLLFAGSYVTSNLRVLLPVWQRRRDFVSRV